jgi:hypothetical protein
MDDRPGAGEEVAMIRHVALALAAGLVASPALAAPRDYAGSWSVLIATKVGDCDKAYRYRVAVDPSGAISYGGQSNFTASGQVRADGSVSVRISRGNQVAQGSGRLTRSSGSGTWSSPSGGCSGDWRADKR